MKDRERIVITGILSLLILGWLGFLVHSSPRFAGSGMGAVFGIAGAVLMLIPLAYPIVKRTPFINAVVTKHVSMQTQLTVHVYAGIFGPVLAIIHTGHKYESWLGILLTAVMLLVVVSGFAVRYLLTYANQEVKDKLLLLQTARGDLDHAWGVLENTPVERRGLPNASLLTAGLASVGIDVSSGGPAGEVTRAHSMERCGEVTEEVLRTVFNKLYAHRVMLEGMILKPNMVLPGLACPKQDTVDEVADTTVKCLLRAVPAAVPGIAFLSGGQSGELASARLNAMNLRFKSRLPWALAFSFSRAIQQPALEIWHGEDANVMAAQKALYHRAKCNRAARRGEYNATMERT